MCRRVKEELLTFEGKPLFPERRATTLPYQLSDGEMGLYEAVTHYVRDEMGRADQLKQAGEGRRGNTVGFALTVLQRRLASSPEAILRSLERRRDRLTTRLLETQAKRSQLVHDARTDEAFGADDADDVDDALYELGGAELENLEDVVVDAATASRTADELRVEISVLDDLVQRAKGVRFADTDRKWTELRDLLLDQTAMFDHDGERRKILIFTEHRDTLNYLIAKIRMLLGRDEIVATIHGGVKREDRRAVQDRFRQDPALAVLVATDAAGDGLNLQRAHLMVNYDLPWNPNRIEQRFGRIHRIGQTEVCHLQNVVRRVADQWRPASPQESFEIVQRLFQDATGAARTDIAAVARRFTQFYAANRAEFPSHVSEPAYEKRIRDCYPLHPELFDRLYEDWSTLERFQRTRGVLRLLSTAIYALWQAPHGLPPR